MVHTSWKTRSAAVLFAALVIGGCAATGAGESDGEDGASRDSSLTASQRKDRAAHLRDVSASRGITKGWLLAGIANAETQMSHCWSELTWACKGPVSADCGGGPVVAGSGDGPCSHKQGGLGMFQFDAGTYSQTIAAYGNEVLTVDGNIDSAIDYVIDMVIDSKWVSGVTTAQQAIDWMNGITVGSADYGIWIKTVTAYYNGCFPGACSIYSSRYAHYDDATREVWSEMGKDFWTPKPPVPRLAIGWERAVDGVYSVHAEGGPDGMVTAAYLVDDYKIATAPKDDPKTAAKEDDFPAKYTFKNETKERHFVVSGRDAKGVEVARGVGMIDSVPGTAVYIWQTGDREYEIGLEREPAEVAYIEVRADEFLLTDGETGSAQSTRNAVRTTFNKLGERDFTITTFNADGTVRGNLHRTFTVE